MIEIIEGQARDVAAIMPIMETAFDPAFGEAWTAAQCLSMLSMPASQLLIARKGAQTAGFALSRWVLDEEELMMIAVAPENQRLNIGKSLLDYMSNKARIAGRKKIFLEVRDGNRAIQFYNINEYQEFSRRKDYYRGTDGQVYDAISMCKEI